MGFAGGSFLWFDFLRVLILCAKGVVSRFEVGRWCYVLVELRQVLVFKDLFCFSGVLNCFSGF